MRRGFLSPNDLFAFLACVICTWYIPCVSSPQVAQPDIGAQIRKARDAANLSQVQLAEQLKLGERTVQAWERNERTPRLGALIALAAHLGQPVAFFYGNGDLAPGEELAA